MSLIRNSGGSSEMTGFPLIIIGGATGVGKSLLSVMLAQKIGGEIISADSMQVYRGFDIGTAKITEEEMEGIPHHLIDILDPDEEFNIYEFQKRAADAIRDISDRGHIPIITGGTGFYIQAVLYDIRFADESSDRSYREELEGIAASGGQDKLFELLKETDPASAEAIHPNNVKRIIRALEYLHESGQMISEHNAESRERRSPYNFVYFVLNRQRSEIYDRIDKRVDGMIKAGLADEVRELIAEGVSPECQAMQGIGYKEMVPFVLGECSLEDAVYRLKLNTRHFAKRQNTWFKREKDAVWINYEDYSDPESMLDHMISFIKSRNII